MLLNHDRVRVIRTSANYRLGQLKTDFETANPVSETVPDQALSLSELLTRYSRGQNVPTRPGTYYGDEPIPDIEKLDFFEKQELKQQNAEYIQTLRDELHEAEETRRTKAKTPKTDVPPANEGAAPVASPE